MGRRAAHTKRAKARASRSGLPPPVVQPSPHPPLNGQGYRIWHGASAPSPRVRGEGRGRVGVRGLFRESELVEGPSSRPSPRTRGEGAKALRPYAIALHTRVKGAEEATEIRLNRNRILRLNADTER